MPHRGIKPFDRVQIVALLSAGHTQQDVADRLNVIQSGVSKVWREYRETGNVTDRPRGGRPRMTTPMQDRYLQLLARRRPTSTARHIGYDFTWATGMPISDQTVRIWLHQGGFQSRRPMRTFAQNQRNRDNRRNCALAHQHWIIAEWRNVMFADETRIGLRPDTRSVRVWRTARRHQEYRHVQEVHPFAGGSVMFWAAIMMGRRTPLIPIYGTLTGPR